MFFTLLAWFHCSVQVISFDTWWHQANGRFVWENWRSPPLDAFSAAPLDPAYLPFVNRVLFGDVVLFLIGKYVFGAVGLQLMRSGIIYFCAWSLLRLCGGKTNIWTLAAAYFMAVGLMQFYLVKNQIFSLVFFAIITLLWARFKAGGRQSTVLWAFPLLMLLWANMHGTVLFGIVILMAIFAGELMERFFSLSPRARAPAYLIFLSVLVSYLIVDARWEMGLHERAAHAVSSIFGMEDKSGKKTAKKAVFRPPPAENGLKNRVKDVFRVLFKGGDETFISEYASPFDSTRLLVVKVLFAFVGVYLVYLLSLRGRVVPWSYVVPSMLSLFISLGYLRTTAFAFSVSLAFMCADLWQNRAGLDAAWRWIYGRLTPLPLLFCVILASAHYHAQSGPGLAHLIGYTNYTPGVGRSIYFSDRLAKWTLENTGGEKVFNSYNLGGFLMWEWYGSKKVLMDGRSILYTKQYMYDYHKDDGLYFVDREKIRYAALCFSEFQKIVKFIEKNWHPVCMDLYTVVLERGLPADPGRRSPTLCFDRKGLLSADPTSRKVLSFIMYKTLNQMMYEGRFLDTAEFRKKNSEAMEVLAQSELTANGYSVIAGMLDLAKSRNIVKNDPMLPIYYIDYAASRDKAVRKRVNDYALAKVSRELEAMQSDDEKKNLHFSFVANLAEWYFQNQKTDEALKCYLLLREIWPEKAEYDYKEALCHSKAKRYKEALECLDRCALKKQETVNSRYFRAYIYTIFDRYSEALPILKGVLEETPEHPQANKLHEHILKTRPELSRPAGEPVPKRP